MLSSRWDARLLTDLPRRKPARRDGSVAAPGGAGAAHAAAVEGIAGLTQARTRSCARRRLDCQRDGLQPEQLDRPDAASRRRGRADRIASSSSGKQSLGNGTPRMLFCASESAGQLAAIVMSLVQSAKLNGHDPCAYLSDVLERLTSHSNGRIDELLQHGWQSLPPDRTASSPRRHRVTGDARKLTLFSPVFPNCRFGLTSSLLTHRDLPCSRQIGDRPLCCDCIHA